MVFDTFCRLPRGETVCFLFSKRVFIVVMMIGAFGLCVVCTQLLLAAFLVAQGGWRVYIYAFIRRATLGYIKIGVSSEYPRFDM